MVDVSEMYKSNSEYLKAEDLGTSMPTLTIQASDVKHFDNGDSKLVLQFTETDKTMPLNMTNARAIAEIHGNNSEGWTGKQIMLFTMPVDFQGRQVQAIRVRAPASQQSWQAPANTAPPPNSSQDYGQVSNGAPPNDDIPFAPEVRG